MSKAYFYFSAQKGIVWLLAGKYKLLEASLCECYETFDFHYHTGLLEIILIQDIFDIKKLQTDILCQKHKEFFAKTPKLSKFHLYFFTLYSPTQVQ